MSKSLLLLFCVAISGLTVILCCASSSIKEPEWVEALEQLGLADRMGDPHSELQLLVVTSYECEPCRETMALVFPTIRDPLLQGKVHLTVVSILTNTPLHRAILESKRSAQQIEPDRLVLLTEYLANDYQALASNPGVHSDQILENIGLEPGEEDSGINWANRIGRSFSVLNQAGINDVPLWFINQKRIKGSPQQVASEVAHAVAEIESSEGPIQP